MRRWAAGTAALGGARYTAKRANTGQEQPHEADDAAPSPEPAGVGQIKELAELREQGILTEEEFVAEKRKLLGI
jgi:Short C-terminal domain